LNHDVIQRIAFFRTVQSDTREAILDRIFNALELHARK
jgi:hypothetical protein